MIDDCKIPIADIQLDQEAIDDLLKTAVEMIDMEIIEDLRLAARIKAAKQSVKCVNER